jgi:hypothetical protein
MRTVVSSLALAAVMGLVPLASVAAHDCFVVNRSANGDAHAAGSQAWTSFTLVDLYEETEQFGFPDLTPAQIDYAVALATSLGVPASVTTRADKTLLESASGWQKGDHATDRKGVDHFFDVYGERLIGALFAALQNA